MLFLDQVETFVIRVVEKREPACFAVQNTRAPNERRSPPSGRSVPHLAGPKIGVLPSPSLTTVFLQHA